MVDFRENLKNKIKKYRKLSNYSQSEIEKKEGGSGIESIFNTGSTTFKTLFKISNILNVDIRNFLIFNEKTHIFKKTFNTFDEFDTYIRALHKKIRTEKGLKAKDVIKKLENVKNHNSIYDFESLARGISLERFYKYLDALDITPDEFFLMNQEYEVIDKELMNEITIEDFNNRLYELEGIKGISVDSHILMSSNNFPTLHMFLKMCKGLRINPGDFFNFDKKDFDEDFKIKDITKLSNYIKHKLELGGFNVKKYIRLDSVFLFCTENGVSISEFFNSTKDTKICI